MFPRFHVSPPSPSRLLDMIRQLSGLSSVYGSQGVEMLTQTHTCIVQIYGGIARHKNVPNNMCCIPHVERVFWIRAAEENSV